MLPQSVFCSAFCKSATYSACCFFKYAFTKGLMRSFLARTSSVKVISVPPSLSVKTPV